MKEQCPKRLDRFLVSKPMNNGLLMKSSVSVGDLSDHLPILFNLNSGGESPLAPLKFNLVWFVEKDYQMLIKDQWVHLDTSSPSSFMYQFVENIARV